jgi:hypothetical protein
MIKGRGSFQIDDIMGFETNLRTCMFPFDQDVALGGKLLDHLLDLVISHLAYA